MRPDELERRLRDALTALVRLPAPKLLHVLMFPDFDRADAIGEFWGYPESRAFAELLIDCEEDRTLRGGVVGMLREGGKRFVAVDGRTGSPRARRAGGLARRG